MRVFPECFPCYLEQTIRTAKFSGASRTQIMEALKEVAFFLSRLKDESIPVSSRYIYDVVSKITGVEDPYREQKKKSNTMAREIVSRVLPVGDGLEAYCKFAVFGNTIDFGTPLGAALAENIDEELHSFMAEPFALSRVDVMEDLLRKGELVLYFLDNAGEIVFDKVLIDFISEEYRVEVVPVVRSAPIINDALYEDAQEVGLTQKYRVLTTGLDLAGFVPHLDEAFFNRYGDKKELFLAQYREVMDVWRKASLIISKGQGNFEGIYGSKRKGDPPVAFLLRAKCIPVASVLSVEVGEAVCVDLDYLESRKTST